MTTHHCTVTLDVDFDFGNKIMLRSSIPMKMELKMERSAFWDVVLCNLLEVQ